MLVDEGLEILTEDEARELLARGEIGRVGITVGALPRILPVDYRVVDGSIVFRASPGSKLRAAVAGAVVAFEVDHFDAATREGWSVLVVGRAEVVRDLSVVAEAIGAGLTPSADGDRFSFVRIEPEFVTGRRIVHDGRGPAPDEGRTSRVAPY